MDDLTKLEMNLEKLSEMFFTSLEEVRKYAPLVALENEDSMENSKENLDRIQYERIENYEEGRKNYESNLVNKSIEINKTYGNIFSTLDELRAKDEFQNTDEELKKNLKDLKEWNELKIKSIKDKVGHIEEIIGGIKKEGSIIVNNDMLD
jgi:hypothetical protein